MYRIAQRPFRYLPELVLTLVVWMSFFAGLGEMEIWGRREQRLAAETVDTLNGNWVIAYLKGQPRLEKPPLGRWVSALSVLLTGRLDEFSLRLPYACAGALTVVLLYLWGKQALGRSAGLAAGVVFCTFSQVVAELRQASADALLVPLITASLWAWWRAEESTGSLRNRWLAASGLFTGLGILAKGPVALMIALVAITTFAVVCRVGVRSRLLCAPWWTAALLASLPWPLLVVVHMPEAVIVWGYEMGLKLGAVPEASEHRTLPLILRFPELVVPWVPLAIAAAILPVARHLRQNPFFTEKRWWLIWGWGIGNLVVFSFWKITKPSYYLPCLPAIALLSGATWHALLNAAAEAALHWRQRMLVVVQWGLFAIAGPALVAAAYVLEAQFLWVAAIVFAAGTAAWNLATARWRAPDGIVWLGLCHAILALALFDVVLPTMNPNYSHAVLAAEADALRREKQAPVLAMPNAGESLWFYMRRPPRPVQKAEQVARVVERTGRALVIGDVRDIRQIQALPDARVDTLVDQSRREGGKGLLIVEVTPLPRVARDTEPSGSGPSSTTVGTTSR